MAHPDHLDPLNYETRIGLTGIGRRVKGEGFVVIPTDQMLDDADGCILNGQMNISAFDHILQSKWEYERSIVSGVTIMRCRDPFRWQKQTVNREKLAEQVRILMTLDNIGTSAVAEAYFRLFPQVDSRVVNRLFNIVIASKPHSNINADQKLGDEFAWIGASLVSCRDGSRVTIDPNGEPFKSLINRGINSNWIKFTSSSPMTESDLDPAVCYDTLANSPELALTSTTTPMIGYSVGTSPDADADAMGANKFSPMVVAQSLAGSLLPLPDEVYRSNPQLLPDIRQGVGDLCRKHLYHVGTTTHYVADLFANPTLIFRTEFLEPRVTRRNLSFEQLPLSLQSEIEGKAKDWLRLFAEGKVNHGSTGYAKPAGKKMPPPVQ